MKSSPILGLATALSCLLGTASASAAVAQVAARGDIAWNDAVEWSSAGAEFDAVPSGTVVGSLGGENLTVEFPVGSLDGVRLDQDSSWLGGFGAGQALLYTDVQDVWLDVKFATPVVAAGLALQPDFLFVSAFEARIEAFDSGGVSLGSFIGSSNTSDPVFLGVESTGADIKRIRMSLVSLTDADPQDGLDPFPGFSVNRLDFLKQQQNGVPDGGSALMLLSMACAGFVAFRSNTSSRRN